jgi:hypothetical protein
MAEALAQGGAGAKQFGIGIGDTVTALALFSNAGVNGSDAGTSLKTMLQRLAAPTKESADAMKQLGLDFFDAQGNFIGLGATAGQLQKSLGKLTAEQKNNALATIFGADSSRVAAILADQGAAGFEKMAGAVNKSGAATDLAAAQNKGFKGSLDNLMSTLETLAIDIGMKVNPVLTKFIDAISGNLKPILAGVAAGVVALGIAFLETSISAGTLAGILAVIFSPITAIVLAVAGVAAGLVILEEKFGLVSKSIAWLQSVIKPVVDFFNTYLMPPLKQIAAFVGGQLKQAWDDLSNAFQRIWVQLQPFLPALKILGIIIGIALIAPLLIAIAVFAAVVLAVVAVITVIARVIGWFAQFMAKVIETGKAIWDFVGGIGGRVVNALGNFGSLLYNSGRDLIQGLLNGAGSLLSNIGKFFLDKVPGWIREPFKKALGIASPSKVFAGYGKNIVQGLAGGISSTSKLAMNAANKIASDVSDISLGMGGVALQASDFDGLDIEAKRPVSVSVSVNNSGIVARSRQEWREINKDGIEAVNEELRAKQLPEIGGGMLSKGSSTV